MDVYLNSEVLRDREDFDKNLLCFRLYLNLASEAWNTPNNCLGTIHDLCQETDTFVLAD